MWLGTALAALLAFAALLGGAYAGAWRLAQGRDAATALVAEAHGEADAIRAAGADEIAAVRGETEAAIAAARAAAAERRDRTLAALDEAGVELAAVRAERDAVNEELDRFIALRDLMGFRMAQHHSGAPVIIVPDGKAIRAWGVPGLSALARHNGQMYRVVDE